MGARESASRKLEISECLKNAGPLKAKMNELLACEKSAIEVLTDNGVHPADLNDLNVHIFQKKSIERIFQLLDELKDELHGDASSVDDEDPE